MPAMFKGKSRVARRAILPALVLATVGMLVAASSSFGQAAVEQYIPDVPPSLQHHGASGSGGGGGNSGSATSSPSNASGGTAGSSGSSGSSSGNGAGGGAQTQKKAAAAGVTGLSSFSDPVGAGTSSGGDASGTGFPLTTFVFSVVAIFLAGLLVYVLLRRRRPRRASH
jgi:hypothetical protein